MFVLSRFPPSTLLCVPVENVLSQLSLSQALHEADAWQILPYGPQDFAPDLLCNQTGRVLIFGQGTMLYHRT